MASFDDDADAAGGSNDEFDNEDEEMEDVNEGDQDQDQDQGQDDDGGDDDDEEDNDDNDADADADADEDEDEDQNDPESPSQRAASHHTSAQHSSTSNDDRQRSNPEVVLTSPSPGRRSTAGHSPSTLSFIPPSRPEALTAQAYDIVPTMAAPQSTSINAIAATPDMRWVFSGGADGYVRMFNWVETANGKVPLTVAQKHPFVDSVMKAGSLLTYWENEEGVVRTPPMHADELGKWTSPVYSLAVQHQAIWLLSGLESGGISLQTCRHQAGTRITTLKEHTSAVSVLNLSQDETSLLSGSWDKTMHDWDLQTGKVKRSFRGSAQQISAMETRPLSDVPVPEVSETAHEPLDGNGTFSSNNAEMPLANGILTNGVDGREATGGGEEDAIGSPAGSLFGEGDHGSLFGEDTGGGGGGGAVTAFDDEDELTRALVDGLQEDAPVVQEDTEMTGMGSGGPVQPLEGAVVAAEPPAVDGTSELPNGHLETQQEEPSQSAPVDADTNADTSINGHTLPHSDEPLSAPSTTTSAKPTSDTLPTQSESTFLSASIDGTLRIWDRRISTPIASIPPYGSTPPWCTGACWSPDGNSFYAGRRNCTVDEYSIHKLGSGGGSGTRGKADRTFRFQQGSGPVYAVRGMANGRHLVW